MAFWGLDTLDPYPALSWAEGGAGLGLLAGGTPGLGQQPEAQPEDPGAWAGSHLLSLSGQSFWQHIPGEPGGGGLGKDGHTGSPGQGGALVTSVVSTRNTRAHTEMHAHTDACPPMHTCTQHT